MKRCKPSFSRVCGASAAPRSRATALKLVETSSLPALHGGDFDHFASDLDGNRLFHRGREWKVGYRYRNEQLVHTIEDVRRRTHPVRKDLKGFHRGWRLFRGQGCIDSDQLSIGWGIKLH